MPGLKSPSPTKRASPNKGKGKQHASTTAASSPQTTKPDDNELLALAERIADQAHLLVRGKGSSELENLAREVTKRSFDRALQSESLSFPHLATLLSSLAPSSGPSTRSSTAAASAEDAEPPFSLTPTPIPELTIDGGMDAEMIWEQMELRGQTVDSLLDEMFGEGDDEDDEEEGEDDEFDDEDGEGEEMDGFGMGGEEGESEEGSEDDDEEEEEEGEEGDFEGFEGGEDGEEEGDEPYYRRLGEGKEEGLASDDTLLGQQGENDPLADETRGLNLDNFDGEGKGGKRARSSRRAPGPPSAVDDDFFSLHDFHVDADEGEYEMAKMLKGEADDEDDDDDEGGEDGGIDLFAPIGGMGGEDDSEEEEEEDLDAAGVMYKDFFDPPPRPLKKSKPTPSTSKKPAPATAATAAAVEKAKDALAKRGVRFSDAVKVKTIPSRHDLKKGKGKALTEEELEEELERELVGGSDEEEGSDEEMDGVEGMDMDGFEDADEEMPIETDDAEEGSEEDGSEEGSEEDEGQETIERFKSSLFEEDEEDQDESAAKNLSRYERRLLALSSQIAALEAENVGPKDWATMGEAKSRDRPVNSLLDEDLEFERMGKTAPVVTEETTKGIEDLIKKRILDNQFDDVERRRPVDPNAFLPSRYLELQDSQSQKSLAEIYAEEYEQTREKEQGREVTHALDKDLEKKHQEIEELFEELAGKLDALSNARFTPKAPKATITTVSNLPSISIESALPTTHSTSTLLAPEEVYQPSSTLTAADKSTLTPAQKKALRQKERGERKAVHDRVERVKEAKLKRRGVKGEKEKAAQMLIGTKGVTVIGKGGKEDKGAAAGGKKRKRGDADGAAANTQTSVGLKL
ncbi:hypothetical protein JCM5296_004697 [Sporobolomyces johnsonii]